MSVLLFDVLQWTCVHDIQGKDDNTGDGRPARVSRPRRTPSARRLARGRGPCRRCRVGRGSLSHPPDEDGHPSEETSPPPQPLRSTERSEEIISASDRISRLRRVRLVINRDVVNPGTTSSDEPSSTFNNLAPFAPSEHAPNAVQTPVLPWHYSVNVPERYFASACENGVSAAENLSSADTPQSLFRNRRRLSHYIAEPNVGRGYIKEIAFGVGGRIIASPFGYGVRLLSFDPDCSELCDRTTDFVASPIQLREVVTNICHGSVVVCTKFSPDSSLLVTGSLGGKIAFHRPRW